MLRLQVCATVSRNFLTVKVRPSDLDLRVPKDQFSLELLQTPPTPWLAHVWLTWDQISKDFLQILGTHQHL